MFLNCPKRNIITFGAVLELYNFSLPGPQTAAQSQNLKLKLIIKVQFTIHFIILFGLYTKKAELDEIMIRAF